MSDEKYEVSGGKSRRSYLFLLIAVILSVVVVVAVVLAVGLGVGLTRSQENSDLPSDPDERAEALLTEYPVIDGSVQYNLLLLVFAGGGRGAHFPISLHPLQ